MKNETNTPANKALADYLRADKARAEARLAKVRETLAASVVKLAGLAKPATPLEVRPLIAAKTDGEHDKQVSHLLASAFPALAKSDAGQWRSAATACREIADLRRRKGDAQAGVSWAAVAAHAGEIGKRFERVTPALVAIAANVSHTLKSDALTAAIKAGREAESAALDRIAAISREIEAAEPATGKGKKPVTHDASALIDLGAGMTSKATGKATTGKVKTQRAAA